MHQPYGRRKATQNGGTTSFGNGALSEGDGRARVNVVEASVAATSGKVDRAFFGVQQSDDHGIWNGLVSWPGDGFVSGDTARA